MWRVSLLSVVAAVLLLGGVTQAARDITKPGDTVQGVPNNGRWPGNEPPPQAIDDQVVTKYLHYEGGNAPSGIRVTPKAGATVVTGLSFTTANDADYRDPITYKLSGSNVSIDGPYTLIAEGSIKDFSGVTAWPRQTKGTTPIRFANTTAYLHYELMFPTIRNPATEPYMQIAEIELLADVLTATAPSPANGALGVTMPLCQWVPGDGAVFEDVYFGTTPELTAAHLVKPRQSAAFKLYYHPLPLTPGQTYYWRVDDYTAAGTKNTGAVWSFMVAPLTAYGPSPLDGDKWLDPEVDLSWLPGQGATKHELYFGTDQAAVAARDAGVFKGSQVAMTFDPGPLAPQTTYYWAVDEIVGANKVAGSVWSLTTIGPNPGGAKGEYFNNTTLSGLPVLTRIDRTINFTAEPGAPVTAGNWSARWTADLEIVKADTYMFAISCHAHTRMWIDGELIVDKWPTPGVGAPTVVSKYFSLPVPLAKGVHSLQVEYICTGTNNVQVYWSTATMAEVIIPAGPLQPPVRARAINPKDNDVNVSQDVALAWSVGEKTVTHDVYFGEDKAAVEAATPADAAIYKGNQALDQASFTPGALDWNKTYYWRVDEVNDAEAGSPWKSSVWSFTTADFIVVDDFEAYVDLEVGRIFQTWIDGWGFTEPAPGNPGNGTSSTVGYTDPPFAEPSIVHGGGQSMPFDYNNINSPYYSETERTWTAAQNWKANGVKDLVLWFRGYPVKFLDDGTTITMSAAGADIYGGTDEFRFAYKRLSGDGSITVRVDNVRTVNSWTKAGVMVRETLEPLAMQVHMVTGAQQSVVEWMYRAISSDTVTTQFNTPSGTNPLPAWVRITRAGNVFTGEYSANGTTWTKITQADGTASSVTMAMPASVYVGMVVSSHVTGTVADAQFSNVKTTGSVSGQWQAVDVGVVHPGNDPAQLYVALQDSASKVAVVNYPDLNGVLTTAWTQWKIPLSEFTGVNVGAIKKMYIGVGDRKAPVADGAGELFIDDIQVVK